MFEFACRHFLAVGVVSVERKEMVRSGEVEETTHTPFCYKEREIVGTRGEEQYKIVLSLIHIMVPTGQDRQERTYKWAWLGVACRKRSYWT